MLLDNYGATCRFIIQIWLSTSFLMKHKRFLFWKYSLVISVLKSSKEGCRNPKILCFFKSSQWEPRQRWRWFWDASNCADKALECRSLYRRGPGATECFQIPSFWPWQIGKGLASFPGMWSELDWKICRAHPIVATMGWNFTTASRLVSLPEEYKRHVMVSRVSVLN